MGIYLNPGNDEFREIVSGNYVDKTGLIGFINKTLFTKDKLTCFSRPRRFGKSFAAKMLCAYYDRSCDSRELFRGLEISRLDSFEKYLNQLDVIYLDITWFLSRADDIDRILSDIQSSVIKELRKAFPGCIDEEEKFLPAAMLMAAQETGRRFFVIIDEWDALFREVKENEAILRSYIRFLRGLFKGGNTAKMIAGAYMTGILPIKKYGTQSAMTDFREFTMAEPLVLAEYVGFTEPEVLGLCERSGMDFSDLKQWYDGYSFPGFRSVYSPNSVMNAITYRKVINYWTGTETYESLKNYISSNLDGLRDAVIAMLGGMRIKIDTLGFQNDLTNIRNRDDVLTLLVHLGYLSYDASSHEVHIPNLEVADSFKLAVQDPSWQEIGRAIKESDDLLTATIQQDSAAVAETLEKIHESTSSVLQYNDENSLSCALTIAYFSARRFYDIVRELPAGKGFADLAFLPRKNTGKPAILLELKYDDTADTAIRQIRENRYDGALTSYQGNLLLVGISYHKSGKGKRKHECVIEQG